MGCEICGRNNCTRTFHSIEEREEFDRINKTDQIKDRLKRIIRDRVYRIKSIGNYDNNGDSDGYDYIKVSDVINVIDEAD
jgi:hypothetical protein